MTQTHEYLVINSAIPPSSNTAQQRTVSIPFAVASLSSGHIFLGPSIAADLADDVAFTSLSQDSFADDWDNPSDAVYNDL